MIPKNVQMALDLLEIWYNGSQLIPDKGWLLKMKTKGLIAHDRALFNPMFGDHK